MSFELFPKRVPLEKRLFDLLLTIPGLIIFSPVMGVIACVLWVQQGRPVLFRQARPGLGGRIFTVYKFRTMKDAIGPDGKPLPDELRTTTLGNFLRSSSLDELPELINVLRGEMSLVGPRPLLVAYLERYSPHQALRHNVLPGVTGWAQINGRNALNWEDKFELDVWYVEHWSLWLDIKILFQTVWKVLKREGINPEGRASVEEFKGSEK